ncbi:uncharacterized protein PSANT_01413 [Moesziomyces antarcticus]|uniref:Uncharacterized protein n=2 Tax=Pseudozyma antarctica TaxID=84753 RepID=A0A5C3FH80_PSEA2|nr:uncharacterized protein PSANT_01413 [Moesziomyces antarcticus]
MAVFKGGPALPKRTERADEVDDAVSGKRQRRTTELLSNPINEDQDMPDDDNSTTQRNNSRKDANKMPMVIEGGDTAKPVSELRSTMDAEIDDAREGSTTPVKEEFDIPAPPTTPKKASRKVKAERNDLLKTPSKKEEAGSSSAAQRSPREQAPLASAWQPEHWDDLNFAILKVVHDHATELYDASPSLAPWRIKGRLLVKLRQLLKDAQGGDVASKRWDVEMKPNRTKASPKKQP